MLNGVTGYVDIPTNVSWAAVRVFYSEVYDADSNSSDLTIVDIKVKSTYWSGVTYYPDGLVQVNGETVLDMNSFQGTHTVRIDTPNEWYSIIPAGSTTPASGTLRNIIHADDGSKVVEIALVKNLYRNFTYLTLSGKYGSGWESPGSSSVSLTTIPRTSTIGATDANIGSKSSVVVTKKAAAYEHSIRYEFGALSGYIGPDGRVSNTETIFATTSISFTVPTSFYDQIPNEKTGRCKLICTTYSGTSKIGDIEATEFTVTASEIQCSPLVSGVVVDSNTVTIALTGDSSQLVRYASNALCTINAKARNGATLVQKMISGVSIDLTEDTRTIAAVESSSVEFTAIDSRGYSATYTVQCSLVDYIKLTANVVLTRDDPTSGRATLSIRGDCFNSTFGAQHNTVSIKYRLARSGLSYGEYRTAEAILDGNTYRAQVALVDLDYEYSYSVQVVVEDKLVIQDRVATVSQGIPVFDWGELDFRFNVPVLISTRSYGATYPSNPKKGQVYFLKNEGAGYTIKIYDGAAWT